MLDLPLLIPDINASSDTDPLPSVDSADPRCWAETVQTPRPESVSAPLTVSDPSMRDYGDIMDGSHDDDDCWGDDEGTRAIAVPPARAGLSRWTLALAIAAVLVAGKGLMGMAEREARKPAADPAASPHAPAEVVTIFGDRFSGEGRLTQLRRLADGRVVGWVELASESVPVEIPARVMGARTPEDLGGRVSLRGDVQALVGPALRAPSTGKQWRQHVVVDWLGAADSRP